LQLKHISQIGQILKQKIKSNQNDNNNNATKWIIAIAQYYL
jgi:hypothetical protein